jgi:hypothetical protein
MSCVSKFTLDNYAYPNIVYVDNYANSFFYFLKKGGDPVYLQPIERGSGGWFRLIKEQWEWLHPHLSRWGRERERKESSTSTHLCKGGDPPLIEVSIGGVIITRSSLLPPLWGGVTPSPPSFVGVDSPLSQKWVRWSHSIDSQWSRSPPSTLLWVGGGGATPTASLWGVEPPSTASLCRVEDGGRVDL